MVLKLEKRRVADVATDAAKHALRQLHIAAIFVYSYVIYMMWLIKFKLIGPPSRAWKITSIFLIREPPPPEGDPYTDDFIALDHSLVDMGPDWKIHVQRYVPDHWDAWKIEIRAVQGHRKKRLVVRHNEDMDFRKDMQRKDLMVLSANLLTQDGEYIDVTTKVRKYVHVLERHVCAHDFFVFDDYDTLRGSELKIRYLTKQGDGFVKTYKFE